MFCVLRNAMPLSRYRKFNAPSDNLAIGSNGFVINCCKSNGYFVVAGVVSSYAEESKEEAG